MKPVISSRLADLKSRLAGFSLKAAKQELHKAERSLRQKNSELSSIELSHSKLLNSARLSEKLGCRHSVRLKQLESLRQEVALQQQELQKKVRQEQQWSALHDHIRGQEISVREASQAEDMIESHAIRTATLSDGTVKPVQFLPESGSGVIATYRQDENAKSTGDMNKEGKFPLVTELVEGRVLARLEREGDSLHIVLITHSLKDQQLLNNFRKKYVRIAEDRGKTNASIRVERRNR